MFTGTNPINQASWWSRLTFAWVGDYIDSVHCDYFKTEVPSKKEGKEPEAPCIKMEQLGTLTRPTPDDDSIERVQLARLEGSFKETVSKQLSTMKEKGKPVDPENLTGSHFSLFKVCLMSQKWLATKIMSSILLILFIQAATPFVNYKITEMLEEQNAKPSLTNTDSLDNDKLISDSVLGYQYYLNGIYTALMTVSRDFWQWTIVLLIVKNAESLINKHKEVMIQVFVLRNTQALKMMVQKKTLQISPATNKYFSESEIRKMSDHDASSVSRAAWDLVDKITIPIWIAISFCWLVYALDLQTVLGFLALISISFYINYRFQKMFEERNKARHDLEKEKSDNMNQCISNVKFLKLYGWKDFFFNRFVDSQKKLENFDNNMQFYHKAREFFNHSKHYMIPILSFSIYMYNQDGSSSQRMLSLATYQTTTMYFERLAGEIERLIWQMSWFEEMKVSLKKITNFFMINEIQTYANQAKKSSNAVQIKGNFSWGLIKEQRDKKHSKDMDDKEKEKEQKELEKDKIMQPLSNFVHLKDIDIQIKKGEFIAVVGDIGSGKSSFLKAIIGDMLNLQMDAIKKVTGSSSLDTKADEAIRAQITDELLGNSFDINRPVTQISDKSLQVNGPLCYVEQEPWIQSKSVADNITFRICDDKINEQNYVNTVRACQLERDFEKFEFGDKTLVGDKGIMLSGGQKARVSLARAVYRAMQLGDQDTIMLLDDPVSALDTHVRQMVFEQLIKGLLKDKTKILATHAVDFMKLADRVVVMEKGRIIDVGSYSELDKRCNYIQRISKVHEENFHDVLENTGKKQDAKSTKPEFAWYQFHQGRSYVNKKGKDEKASVLPSFVPLFKKQNTNINANGYHQEKPEQPGFIPLMRHGISLPEQPLPVLQDGGQREWYKFQVRPVQKPQEAWYMKKPSKTKPQVAEAKAEDFKNITDAKLISEMIKKYQKKENKPNDKEAEDEESVEEDDGEEKNNYSMQDAQATKDTYWKLLSITGGLKTLIPFFSCIIIRNSIDAWKERSYVSWTQQTKDESIEKLGLFGLTYTQQVYASVFSMVLFCMFHGYLHHLMHQSIRRQSMIPNLRRILNAPVNLYFDMTPQSLLERRFNEDVHHVNHSFGCLNWAIEIVGGAIYTLMIAMWTIPSIIFFVLYVMIFSTRMQKRQKFTKTRMKGLGEKTGVPLHRTFNEAITGSTIIRINEKQQDYNIKTFELIDRSETHGLYHRYLWQYFSTRNEFMGSFIVFAGYILAFLVAGKTSMISLYISVEYTQHIFNCMSTFSEAYFHLTDCMRRAANVFELEKVPQEKEKPANSKAVANFKNGKITIKHVDLKYRPDRELVLKDLDFQVDAGLKVGVVGRTGAGKSTISNALTRIVELEKGSIEIDGIDIADLDLTELRNAITIIPQEPTLLNGTLKFNMDPFDKVSEDKIHALCQKAGLDKILSKETDETPRTYLESKIESSGTNFSAGERQLICLCRAVLRQNKVVLLDEATASIDVLTEQKVQALVQDEFKDATVLTIAHRINTIVRCDRVLCLQGGKVLEYGSPTKLAAEPTSEFAKMIDQINNNCKDFI